jgi:aminopeptidase N
LVHEPWFYGEHQVYAAADYSVEIALTEPVDGLVLAASAPPAREGELYTYLLEDARNFVWSASQMYQVLTATVGETLVASYFFAYDLEAGTMALQNTADALALYSETFGPYPHASLSVVEADFLDGMEYSGLYFLSRGFYNLYDGTARGYLTAIAAHETAHQWWYGLVGNDQALEPWLDEAMCTYSERLFYEHIYPESLDWWWDFRVNYYQPVGWVDSSIYDYGGFRPYRDAVYLRGAIFLEELRILVGEEAFFAFLRDYAYRRAGQIATTLDFFAILGEHTTVDFSGLVTQYFEAGFEKR